MARGCVSGVRVFASGELVLAQAGSAVEAAGMLFDGSVGGPEEALAWAVTAQGLPDYLVVDCGFATNSADTVAQLKTQVSAIYESCSEEGRVPPLLLFVGPPIFAHEVDELYRLGLHRWILRAELAVALPRELAELEAERRDAGEAIDADRLVSVVGTVGGAGSSVLAANIAWHAAKSGRNVALIEADVLNGRQAGYFGLPMDQGFDSLAKMLVDRDADKAMLERIARSRPVSGMPNLAVLSSFQHPGTQNPVRADAKGVERIVALAQLSYDLVVLDVGVSVYPLGREVFAGRLSLVATPTCESLETALRVADVARRHKTPMNLVLNRVDEHPEGGPGISRFADALKLDEDAEIAPVPFDRRVLAALVQSQPEAPLVEEKGELGDAVRRAVAMALGEPLPKASSSGWFSDLKELFA
jgi:MinD-like ATPase involved in chromosome partitioning or flagellar assembly